MRRITERLWVPVLLAALVIIFLWPVILPPAGQVTSGDDILGQFYPWSRIFVEGLRRGQLVLWNPYSFLGMPFQANPQAALFYPVTWLFVAPGLDAGRVFGLALALHLWLMALGTYALARTLGVSKPGALLSGVAFAFGGFVTSKLFVGFHVVLGTLAWLPWAMAALYWAWQQERVGRAALAGLPIALSGLAGAIPFFQFTLIGVTAFGLYLVGRSWRASGRRAAARAAAQLASALSCGLLVGAVQLLPTFELSRLATRAGETTYEFASGRPLPITHWIMLVAPDVFGAPVGQVKYWGAEFYHELQIYLGIAPLVLALLAVGRGDQRKWFWIGLGSAALVYALGAEGFLHPLFYRFVPGVSLMRLPARASVLFALSMAVLAGLGWDRISNLQSPISDLSFPVSKGFGWAGGLALMAALLAFVEVTLRVTDATARGQLIQVMSQSLRFVLLLGLTYLALRWRWHGGSERVFTGMVFALTLFDLWSFGGKFVLTQPLGPNSAWWPVADRVMAGERASYRVLEYGFYIVPGTNDNISFHLSSLGGYDPLAPRDPVSLTEVNYGLEPKLLDMLAVRYILLGDTTTIDTSGYREVARDPASGAIIYERPTWLPRAFVVHQARLVLHDQALARLTDPAFDPRREALVEAPLDCGLVTNTAAEPVNLVRDDLNRVIFQVRAMTPGLLVMSDTFYPGWSAEVDGKPTPIVRADYALRGICLPAGEHTLVFRFDPITLRVGLLLSAIGLVVVAVLSWKAQA
jgi:hypothetical protein